MNKQIVEIIKPVLGLRCEHAARYFGTMLLIDFGKMTPYISKVDGKEMKSWEWGLGVHDSRWYLEKDGELVVGNGDTEEAISKEIKALEGRRIERIEVSDDLSQTEFDFSDGYKLFVSPKRKNTVEQWDLKTSEGKYLIVYSDLTWEYVPGNTPVRE